MRARLIEFGCERFRSKNDLLLCDSKRSVSTSLLRLFVHRRRTTYVSLPVIFTRAERVKYIRVSCIKRCLIFVLFYKYILLLCFWPTESSSFLRLLVWSDFVGGFFAFSICREIDTRKALKEELDKKSVKTRKLLLVKNLASESDD